MVGSFNQPTSLASVAAKGPAEPQFLGQTWGRSLQHGPLYSEVGSHSWLPVLIQPPDFTNSVQISAHVLVGTQASAVPRTQCGRGLSQLDMRLLSPFSKALSSCPHGPAVLAAECLMALVALQTAVLQKPHLSHPGRPLARCWPSTHPCPLLSLHLVVFRQKRALRAVLAPPSLSQLWGISTSSDLPPSSFHPKGAKARPGKLWPRGPTAVTGASLSLSAGLFLPSILR